MHSLPAALSSLEVAEVCRAEKSDWEISPLVLNRIRLAAATEGMATFWDSHTPTALSIEFSFDTQARVREVVVNSVYFDTPMIDSTPMMTMTTRISMRVKPFDFRYLRIL